MSCCDPLPERKIFVIIYGTSVVDPKLFVMNPDPDPTFQGVTDPDPTFKKVPDPISDPTQNIYIVKKQIIHLIS
jgi:hypothetical protein